MRGKKNKESKLDLMNHHGIARNLNKLNYCEEMVDYPHKFTKFSSKLKQIETEKNKNLK